MTGKKSLSKFKYLRLACSVERFPAMLYNSGRDPATWEAFSRKRLYLSAIRYPLSAFLLSFVLSCYAQEAQKEGPVTVNGDTVEYSSGGREVLATGNVLVDYKGAKLSCEKMTVNTETKEGQALGNVRLEDAKGIIEGDKANYNFDTKAGSIVNAKFRANPYFGRARNVEKISDAEFIAYQGYMSTCGMDDPHWRLKSKKIDMYPNDKVIIKKTTAYVGKAPVFFLPQYKHSMKDPLMHVQLTPGHRKGWGYYMFSAWRYDLTDYVKGRIYLDYREKLGVAEGLGANYTSRGLGRGDYKFYYTQERDKSKRFNKDDVNIPKVFQRYLIRWRHQWDIDNSTNLTAEYYKITDSRRVIHGADDNDFLKDYFFREYEEDMQPPSYVSLHRAFRYSSADLFLQKRTNRWYSGYLEKLPEIKYTVPAVEISDTPFYFENSSSFGNYNKKNTSTSTPTANAANPDISSNRLDTTNKFSLPMKVSFIEFKPFAASRQTFYDKDVNESAINPRTIFYSGADMGTKFYRVFDVKTNFLKLDLNGLRHIITPTVAYSYNHEPTIANSKLKQIDGIDSLSRGNSASLELSNKFQTKRNNKTVDLLNFKTNTSYLFKPKAAGKPGSNFSDLTFDLEFLPYSWMRVDSDATFKRSGSRYVEGYNRFSNVNYDFHFNFGTGRSLGFGQRYVRKGGNDLTQDLKWRLSPKWYFSAYQRRNIGHDPTLKRGLREQEYSVSRDLHCWTVNFIYNVRRNFGESVWLTFTLKAFPELEFEYDQSYHQPKPGTQSEPVR